ncbi:porin [Pontitalea aquivivens]|uniref:porin n=1 Tax=Pontitalea aquivivens TaxID=3388663 RepID=UPI00397110F1
MKKILLASTALVAFAGAAAAEVKIEGTGIISVIGGDGLGANDAPRFLSSADVQFYMSGETDGGLAFGAKIDLDEAGLTANANETVWVSGAFGKFTIGDTDSALDWAIAETTQGANLIDEYTIHAGAFANFLDEKVDNTIARYEYAMGDFAFAASLEIDDADVADPSWALGAKYNMGISGGSVTLAAGYQDTTVAQVETSVATVGASVKLDNGLSASASYSQIDNYSGVGLDADQWGIGAQYVTGALTLGASYGEIDSDLNTADVESYALAASYDLGGGARVFAGMISEKTGAGPSLEKYQAGVALSF